MLLNGLKYYAYRAVSQETDHLFVYFLRIYFCRIWNCGKVWKEQQYLKWWSWLTGISQFLSILQLVVSTLIGTAFSSSVRELLMTPCSHGFDWALQRVGAFVDKYVMAVLTSPDPLTFWSHLIIQIFNPREDEKRVAGWGDGGVYVP